MTFYAQFRTKPLGRNVIRICNGTACHVNGAKEIYSVIQDELGLTYDETTDDGVFSLLSVACLGCCLAGPGDYRQRRDLRTLDATQVAQDPSRFQTDGASRRRSGGQGMNAMKTVHVGLGTCGISAGGERVYQAFQKS